VDYSTPTNISNKVSKATSGSEKRGGVNLVKGRMPFSPEDGKCDAKRHRFGYTVESGPASKTKAQ
jgi:hypothetical protein